MNQQSPFKWRHFEAEIIVTCVRWYLRYSLSYRDLEEMMAERGLSVDHATVARWVSRYAPILNERMRPHLRRPNRSWRVDETYVRVAGKWTYLYRALDSEGNTIDFMLSPYRDRIAAFPRWLYHQDEPPPDGPQVSFLAGGGKTPEGSERRDAITDGGVAHFEAAYPGKAITK